MRCSSCMTFLPNGGLNHNVFLCLLRLVWVFVFAGSYLSWAVKLLCFKASLYVGAATSNISLLEDSWLMRLLIDLRSSSNIEGGD